MKELIEDLRVLQNGSLEEIIEVYELLSDGQSFVYGLCSLFDYREYEKDIRRNIFRSWPKFSGCTTYPIPCPSGEYEGSAYHRCSDDALTNEEQAENYYGDHEYGNNRRELAGFVADKLEEMESQHD